MISSLFDMVMWLAGTHSRIKHSSRRTYLLLAWSWSCMAEYEIICVSVASALSIRSYTSWTSGSFLVTLIAPVSDNPWYQGKMKLTFVCNFLAPIIRINYSLNKIYRPCTYLQLSHPLLILPVNTIFRPLRPSSFPISHLSRTSFN